MRNAVINVLICSYLEPELVEKIRALPVGNGGQIPAVALTAFNRPEDREAAFEAGFQKHLGKPVDMDALIQAIIETAESKQTKSSTL